MEEWKSISYPSKNTQKELQIMYSNWHKKYDKDMDDHLMDIGPKIVTELLSLFVPLEFRREIRIWIFVPELEESDKNYLKADFNVSMHWI